MIDPIFLKGLFTESYKKIRVQGFRNKTGGKPKKLLLSIRALKFWDRGGLCI